MPRRLTLLATLLVSSSLTPAMAQDLNWNGTAGKQDWSTGSNWTPGGPPGSTNRVNLDKAIQSQITKPGAQAGEVVIGNSVGNDGSLLIQGKGTLEITGSRFYVGAFGKGAVRIEDGGQLTSLSGGFSSIVGNFSGAVGSVTVDGTDSLWTNHRQLLIGYGVGGNGTVTASNLGEVKNDAAIVLGQNRDSTGLMRIETGGKISTAEAVIVGLAGQGAIVISSTGSALEATKDINLGYNATGNGSLIVTNNGTASSTENSLIIGTRGTGSVTLSQNGNVSAAFATIGKVSGSKGTLNIGAASGAAAEVAGTFSAATLAFGPGAGTLVFNHTGSDYRFAPAMSGSGTVKVEHGRTVLTGNSSAFSGSTTIASGATLQVGDDANGGSFGGAIADSGSLVFSRNTASAFAGAISGSGSLTKAGLGMLTLSGNSGAFGGSTSVAAGGVTITGHLGGSAADIAGQMGSAATAEVTGAGSRWDTVGGITVGNFGAGVLTLANGGTVSGGALTLAGQSGSSGTLNIGAASGQAATGAGTLAASSLLFGAGNASVVFNHTDTDYRFAYGLTGAKLITAEHGRTVLTGDSSGFSGNSAIAEGAILQVGDGGTQGRLGGDIRDAGSLVFDRSDDTLFTGAISGTGILGKKGAGKLDLTGNSAGFAGAVAVAAGSLTLTGQLGAADSVIADASGSLATAEVTGAGSSWTTGGDLIIGNSGFGMLTLTDSASARAGAAFLARNAGSMGTLNVGAASGAAAREAGTFSTATLAFGPGTGTLVFNHTAGDYLFAPAMSGSGTVKVEHGRTVLTGESSAFSGRTTIAPGAALQVGDGATAGSFGGAVVNNGSLIFDRSDDTQFTGSLAGAGSLAKDGAGVLELTGTSASFTGATTIVAGGLRVNGSLAGSPVTALNATTLSGGGTVGGVVAQAGSTVAPGNGSLGTLGVTADYRQLAASTYAVEVMPGSNRSDLISISGAAMLDAGAILDVGKAEFGQYELGDLYRVLSAAGGVNGSYVLTGDTARSAFYGLLAVYDPNDVYLKLAQLHPFSDAAWTPNQVAVASGLQSLPEGTVLRDAVGFLDSYAEARDAFDQLSGEVHPSIAGAMVQDSRFIREGAVGRLRCIGVARPEPGRHEGCAQGRVWSQAYGAWQNTDGDGNAAEFSDDVNGFVVGADTSLGAGWQAGVLAGTAHADYAVNARSSSGSSDSYTLGAYAGTEWSNIGIRLGAAYSWYDIDTTRNVAFTGLSDSLDANSHAGTAQFFGDIGYAIDLGPASLEPFASLAQVNVHSDGFSENGGDAALSAGDADTNVTFATLGARTAATVTAADLHWTASGMAGWQHGWGDLTPEMEMRFAGSDSFTIQGVPIAADVASVEAGLAVAADDISFGVYYQGQFGDGLTAQGATGRLSFAF